MSGLFIEAKSESSPNKQIFINVNYIDSFKYHSILLLLIHSNVLNFIIIIIVEGDYN